MLSFQGVLSERTISVSRFHTAPAHADFYLSAQPFGTFLQLSFNVVTSTILCFQQNQNLVPISLVMFFFSLSCFTTSVDIFRSFRKIRHHHYIKKKEPT